ncbi:MAG: divergent polysaccharide deacetylase family protein [Sulfitobacter sp.]
MARGFLSGALWGGVFAVGTAGVVSVLAPPPKAPQVSDAAPTAVSPDRVQEAGSGEAGSDTDRVVVTTQVAPQTQAPAPDSVSALDSEMQTPTDAPLTGAAGDGVVLSAPDAGAVDSRVDVTGDAPVLPNPQALAPMEPQAVDDVAISTEPAQPPAPELEQPEPPLSTEITSETGTGTALETTDTQEPAVVPDQQVQPVPAPERIAGTDPEAPQTEAEPEESGTDDLASAGRPAVRQPVGTIGDRDTGVTIRRPGSNSLVQIDNEAIDSEAAETEAAPQEGADALGSDTRPVNRFAQNYDDPEGKPLMAIVLIDDGSSPVTGAAGIAALRSFPYPLNFAVDAGLADAKERMTIYRNEGFEVLAMIDLPEGAQAADAETAFGSILPQLDEVVGVLEGVKGGLQGSKEVADQVTSILLQSGHGLLTQDRGLNTMPKLARKGGVPADAIFRDFDSKGQSASVIRRFLDQAAFKAGQEGAVVMLGRLRPDTISALLLWGLQDRAGKVALTPVSAVLLRED